MKFINRLQLFITERAVYYMINNVQSMNYYKNTIQITDQP